MSFRPYNTNKLIFCKKDGEPSKMEGRDEWKLQKNGREEEEEERRNEEEEEEEDEAEEERKRLLTVDRESLLDA
jgi:hypothetical protein